jgi:hypothetical protein
VLSSPPPPPPPLGNLSDAPARPSFKEPPREFDNLPPRPAFKEPPPELDGVPPRPSFADPPPEDSEGPAPSAVSSSPISPPPPPPPATNVIPPTPQKRGGVPGQSSPRKIVSRSPSPPKSAGEASAGGEDVVLGSGKSSISRSGSAQSNVVRGPRVVRAPPRSGGGNVSSLVSNLNRNSIGSPPTGTPRPASPGVNRLSGSPVRRPSSIVGRSAASFSRRTMASDAEDDVVEKK